jgi:pyruvate,water dikinase
MSNELVLWFDEIGIKDISVVGGKNASLGEMYRNLTGHGIRVPNGFAVTANAYFLLLKQAGLRHGIEKLLRNLNTRNIRDLQERGIFIRRLITEAAFPDELEEAIVSNYKKLAKQNKKNVDVAVRSSGTAEDLAEASFAGQQDTFLNVRGTADLLRACKLCFASVFTDRAISYREDQHFDHLSVGLSITVQKMVRSDKGASGVMFTVDTESGHKDMVLINSSYGLGEIVVQGAACPDEFYVHKPTLKSGFRAIVSKSIGTKKLKITYAGRSSGTKCVAVPKRQQGMFSISDDEALELARWAMIIEDHYSEKAGTPRPMDIEWAKDGITSEMFIVQARPETVISRRDPHVMESYELEEEGELLVTGHAVGAKIGVGRASVIRDSKHISSFREGDVLVTYMTDPDWEPIMKIASAIVTDEGGRTSHAAIVSRELGIPAIVGAEGATREISPEAEVTVCCSEGDIGRVYSGKLGFKIRKTNLKKITRPKKTEIKMIFGTPELAFKASQIPNDGVGLARQEFIINSYIKIHPMALVNFGALRDKKAKREIAKLTAGYDNKEDYYVEKLAHGIGMIGAAFYPRERSIPEK